ncbi:hypothetical protein CFC21_026462 [Triticum aestivum]|uniref:Uncharacterized protein n=2 Tax=Triticum aestivum TaxID=4565 RepID=A0A9R1ELJ9_WHEAT|nr:hypothetical protein CFC21_026462 [Triticum aestivum]
MDLYWDSFWYFGISWLGKHRHEHNQLPMRQWPKKQIQKSTLILIAISVPVLGSLVAAIAVGPVLWVFLSTLVREDYGITDREATKANMKRALNLFYYAASAHGFLCTLWVMTQTVANNLLVNIVSGQHGFSPKVLRAYIRKTKQMCVNYHVSATSWNLITYGAGLLDSSLPEEYAAGGRVLTMLIDQDVPSQTRQTARLLIRSPRQRIQKLVGTLAWRSPAEQEMRWLAARIVEHVAADLNLAHFPGALECISSLFNQLPVVAGQGNMDLILPGLRILENLAHDEDNCTAIYNNKGLFSKIVAPLSSNECVQYIKSSAAWTEVVHRSLRVVKQLMISPGLTGKEIRSLITDDSHVVRNLEAVLDIDMKSNSSIIELQMGTLKALTQLALHHPTSTSAEKLIERALHIFISIDWMEDYLKHENDMMEEAKKTANRLKESAGLALEMLSSDPEAVKGFTVCEDDVHHLTELLDCNVNTIECKISATDTVEIEISMDCRISATVILKHLSNYVKAPTLRKALGQLLPVQQDAPSTSRSHINNRTLQATLLSLVVTICVNNNINLAGILLSQTPPDTLEDFVVRLKNMVEDNMYGTHMCLAIQKLTCKMVTEFMKHDRNVEVIDRHNIVGTLLEASKTMAELESSMLFAGINHHDRCGVPLTPFSSVLAKNAEDLLTQRKQALGINTVPAGLPVPLP